MQGRVEALLELLTAKFGPVPDPVADRIRSADPARVRVWTARVLTATTLDELFA
jgi:hypothetical protein